MTTNDTTTTTTTTTTMNGNGHNHHHHPRPPAIATSTSNSKLVPLADGDGGSGGGVVRPVRHRRLLTSSSTVSEYSGASSINSIASDFCDDHSSCNSNSNSRKSETNLNDYGLVISVVTDKYSNKSNQKRIQLQLCADENYINIHPHVYAPKSMVGTVHTLGGGGSGVAVFEGQHPQLGDLVMKHGGSKDLKELFALATVEEDLYRRGLLTNNMDSAKDMSRRLPEFKMLYISPFHIVEKGKILVGKLRHIIQHWMVVQQKLSFSSLEGEEGKEEGGDINKTNPSSIIPSPTPTSARKNNKTNLPSIIPDPPTSANMDQPSTPFSNIGSPKPRRYSFVKLDEEHRINGGMSIRLYESDDTTTNHIDPQEKDDGNNNNKDDNNNNNMDVIHLVLDTESPTNRSLALIVPKDSCEFIDERTVVVTEGDPYMSLKSIVSDLMPIMEDRLFKFTLAQKRIGGSNPKTGNQWLYEGQLHGPILQNLCTQYIKVVRELQALTLPEEVDVVDFIRDEVAMFENGEYSSCAELSSIADKFVGKSIIKNFHPQKGRGKLLREISKKFREGSIYLTEEELLPAKHLGDVLRGGALMSDTFENAPMEPTVLQPQQHFWRNILARAVDDRETMSPTALTRIWTCGMTDAGIHNLFVNESDLFFFDLGEPQLQSVPGFLTKFLFSFFHTLGMEEDENNNWIRRFVPTRNNKLALTEETVELLPKAYNAFEECLDRLVHELLEDDDDIRWLLLQYVTLQLLSDTAFCIQKWEIKGGGEPRDDNHQKGIERWLWRALWDIYVAYDINTPESWARFQVEHPHFQTPVFDGRYSVTGFDELKKRLSTGEKLSDSLRKYLEENEGKEDFGGGAINGRW